MITIAAIVFVVSAFKQGVLMRTNTKTGEKEKRVFKGRDLILHALPFVLAILAALLGFIETSNRWQDQIELGCIMGGIASKGFDIVKGGLTWWK